MLGLICDAIESSPGWDSTAARKDGEMLTDPTIVYCLKQAYLEWFGDENPRADQFFTVIGDPSRARRQLAAMEEGVLRGFIARAPPSAKAAPAVPTRPLSARGGASNPLIMHGRRLAAAVTPA
eukprot:6867945-Heterocapsa_arctica.AAC.1